MTSKKVALFAFNGEPMCFAHALLNVMDMHKKGMDVRLIIEGSATTLVKTLSDETQPFAKLYAQVREAGLIDGVCKACSAKMGSLDAAVKQGLRLLDDMAGHPSFERYIKEGYQILSL
jgi:hypothetical protein